MVPLGVELPSGAFEAPISGALDAPSGAFEALSGALDDSSGALDALSGPEELSGAPEVSELDAGVEDSGAPDAASLAADTPDSGAPETPLGAAVLASSVPSLVKPSSSLVTLDCRNRMNRIYLTFTYWHLMTILLLK